MYPSQSTIVILLLSALGAAGYVGGTNYNTYNVNISEEITLHEQDLPQIPAIEGINAVNMDDASVREVPEYVRALYMTAWVGGTKSMREHVVSLLDTTEANALVIDIKDDTGMVAFPIEGNEILNSMATTSRRIPNIKAFIEELHEKDIYVIGRIAVFQDPSYVKKFSQEAVKTSSGEVWADRKGLTWIDAGSENSWDYIATLAEYSASIGFDEINFDYIRYPTDGNLKEMRFHHTGERKKSDVLKSFYEYLDNRLRPQGIYTSADLFGMVTTQPDDLGIGQILTEALPHFDAIAPMVYPSHYPANFAGIKNPSKQPYETITVAMRGAVKKAESIGEDPAKIRPWLQDFNYGAIYTAEMVREQMQAAYEQGIYSWYMWDPGNKYTRSAYKTPEAAEEEYQMYLELEEEKEMKALQQEQLALEALEKAKIQAESLVAQQQTALDTVLAKDSANLEEDVLSEVISENAQ